MIQYLICSLDQFPKEHIFRKLNPSFKLQFAERGDAEAQNNLAICYEDGTGVPKDEEKAVEWYTKWIKKN